MPTRTARSVHPLSEEHEDALQHLPWPAQSPDLNIIEILCLVSKSGVRSSFQTPPSLSIIEYVPRKQGFYTGCLQKNGAVSKVNKKFISHLTRAKRTPSAAATVEVSHALPAVSFSCLMRGRGASFQDGVAAGKGFLCAPF